MAIADRWRGAPTSLETHIRYGVTSRCATTPAKLDWIYDRQVEYGSAGSLFWNLGPEGAPGTFDVNPSSPLTWARIQEEAP